VYFDHSIHVNKGVGCETCHGRVDDMPLMRQASRLQMSWCLECHRNPEKFLRPREDVFTMGWTPPEGVTQAALGAALAKRYGIRSEALLTSCSTCHR
jgi:cytochrome c553